MAGGWNVRLAVRDNRRVPSEWRHRVEVAEMGDMVGTACWTGALIDVDVVVTLAGRAHVMRDDATTALEEYRRVNVGGTSRLARAALERGVRRLVYVSSIKACGEASPNGPLQEDQERPEDAYGQSKLEAEHVLKVLLGGSATEYTIVRPPLVYGANVKGNMASLLRGVDRGWPLPIGAVRERRSLVYAANLADFLVRCAAAPAAAGQTFHVTDLDDLSTPQLAREIARQLGRPARIVSSPVPLLLWLGRLAGKRQTLVRLVGPLQVDASKAHAMLNWTPPYSLRDGLCEMITAYRTTPQKPTLPLASRGYLPFKRMLDVIGAASLLLALFPFIALIAACVYLDDPGPVIFRQERAGRQNRAFIIYKFRSMRLGTPSVPTAELRDLGGGVVTRFGTWLRRTSLDELPQLLNILRGEMSFVGPRPALFSQGVVLDGRVLSGAHMLLPGITGLAQVSGRDDLDDCAKVQRDTEYLHALSACADVQILLRTVHAILSGQGNK